MTQDIELPIEQVFVHIDIDGIRIELPVTDNRDEHIAVCNALRKAAWAKLSTAINKLKWHGWEWDKK